MHLVEVHVTVPLRVISLPESSNAAVSLVAELMIQAGRRGLQDSYLKYDSYTAVGQTCTGNNSLARTKPLDV